MVTTIQISDSLKSQLAREKGNKTYEQFLKELLRQRHRLVIADQMKAYGKKYGDEEVAELRDWEGTDVPWK